MLTFTAVSMSLLYWVLKANLLVSRSLCILLSATGALHVLDTCKALLHVYPVISKLSTETSFLVLRVYVSISSEVMSRLRPRKSLVISVPPSSVLWRLAECL